MGVVIVLADDEPELRGDLFRLPSCRGARGLGSMRRGRSDPAS